MGSLEQALFFNTCCAKKLKLKQKTLEKKTQPLGGTPLKFEKLKKITKFLFKKFWGGPKNAILKTHIVKKEDIFDVCQ